MTLVPHTTTPQIGHKDYVRKTAIGDSRVPALTIAYSPKESNDIKAVSLTSFLSPPCFQIVPLNLSLLLGKASHVPLLSRFTALS